MRCGCRPQFTTDKRVLGVDYERALSIGCTCCNTPSGTPCGGSGQRDGVRWGDFCPSRLAHIVNQGEQKSLLL